MSLKTLSTNNSAFKYVHSNAIYDKVSAKGKKPYKSWLKDGVHGGPCSMKVLITWMSNKFNYKRWKREYYPIDRVAKKDLLEEIIDKLREVGIYHRLSKDIASKISTLQSNYRQTRKWKDTEGWKLMNEHVLHEELLKRFPYWDALHPVFGCSSSAMDIKNIVSQQHHHPRQGSTDSISSHNTSNEISKGRRHLPDCDLERHIHIGKREETERMQKSREMLILLQQRTQVKKRQERLLLQHEKRLVEGEFMKCLYEAGFTPTEALYYL